MDKQFTLVVENDLVDYLQRLGFDIDSRLAVIDRMFVNHKDDTDASVFESVPWKKYSKELEDAQAEYKRMKEGVMEEVKHTFKPEFINRIDEILVFHMLSKENICDIAKNMLQSFKKRVKKQMSASDKIDRIVTNRFLALPIFAVVMFVVYYVSVTTVGTILTDWTNDTLFGEWIIPGARGALDSIGCAPWLSGLLVDGIIRGVGAVLLRKPKIQLGEL